MRCMIMRGRAFALLGLVLMEAFPYYYPTGAIFACVSGEMICQGAAVRLFGVVVVVEDRSRSFPSVGFPIEARRTQEVVASTR